MSIAICLFLNVNCQINVVINTPPVKFMLTNWLVVCFDNDVNGIVTLMMLLGSVLVLIFEFGLKLFASLIGMVLVPFLHPVGAF